MIFARRRVSILLIALWATLALTTLSDCEAVAQDNQRPQPPKRRPNIVLLLADDLGYGELGCQGNLQIPTPHIDSIAGNGVRFTQGYVTAPYCSASRAGLLTGKYQTRFGYEFNPVGALNEDPDAGLPVSERTLADHLHDAGYATGLIGKWHLGGTAKYHPYRRGFDEFFGFLHEGHYFVPPPYRGVTTMLRRRTLPTGSKGRWTSRDGQLVLSTHMSYDEPDYDADNPIYRGGQPVEEHAYLTDALTREAVDFIDRNAERPFFLYLAYNAVHSPLQGADAYMRKFAHIDDIHRRIFAAMLSNLDDSVGSVLQKLRDMNLEEDTLIFFISDNGGPTRELTSSNAPLRGEKGQVYEGGIRVPFLLQWKGQLPSGVTYDQPVISLDVFATASNVAEHATPAGIDGVDLLPYLTGQREGQPHESLFWRLGKRTAIRVGDWKLLKNASSRNLEGDWELYDLSADVSESKNLAAVDQKRVQQLETAWKQLNAQMIDPVWTPWR
jgi:arylsulfatase A-like enzyme